MTSCLTGGELPNTKGSAWLHPTRIQLDRMKTALLLHCVCFLGLSLASTTSSAAIVVIPNNPASTQPVQIQLVNQYFSATTITSASITRSGNQFTINQSVSESCFLPSAPTLTSAFDVGVLPAGTYQVTAFIQNTRPCGNYTVTETASFTVFDPVRVPAGSPFSYLVAAYLLAFFGMRRLGQVKGKMW